MPNTNVEDRQLRKEIRTLLGNMKQRCTNPKSQCYKNYGGRGIRVCERWSGPGRIDNFIDDMGFRPKGLTLDRIDNDGNYEPGNCRWATRSIQSYNQRKKHDKEGLKGIWKNRGKWSAYITVNHKQIHLGSWIDINEAIKHRKEAEEVYYGESVMAELTSTKDKS